MLGNIINTPPHCPHVMYIFVFTMFVPCCCCLLGTLQHELLLSARFRKTRRYTNVVCCEVLSARISKTGRCTNGLLLPEDLAFGAVFFCPCDSTIFGPQPGSMVHFPAHDTPSTPGSAWANPPKKKTQPAGLYKYVHTNNFLVQTRNQSYKRWENATWGHKAQATNVQNTILQCFEFL